MCLVLACKTGLCERATMLRLSQYKLGLLKGTLSSVSSGSHQWVLLRWVLCGWGGGGVVIFEVVEGVELGVLGGEDSEIVDEAVWTCERLFEVAEAGLSLGIVKDEWIGEFDEICEGIGEVLRGWGRCNGDRGCSWWNWWV